MRTLLRPPRQTLTEPPLSAAPARTLDAILRPASIAVVGASRAADAIGHQVLANLIGHGFTGAAYPVNPGASAVCSIQAYPGIAAVPASVDLAVIAVPAERVVEVAEECGEAGVRGIVVISAGFREIGERGAERERRLLEVVRRHGMRLVGPNCMGVINTDPAVSMNATFAPVMPPRGGVAFLSQSGALGLSVLDYASEYGIGISQFVSVGNKPDVSGNDLLEYWEDDPTVSAILLYVESFGNPLHFREIAARVSRKKPIVALKAGHSAAGARAASSHTGALAANDRAVDSLLEQAGVLRARSVEELFDVAMAFGDQPLPRSGRVAVVTNSGGPGILAADALETHGLDLAELADSTAASLRPVLPEGIAVGNPLDLIATARPSGYRAALEALLKDDAVDSALAIFVPPLGVRQEDVAEAIVAAAATCPRKPVLAVLMGRAGLPQGRAELNAAGIPAYVFPESAARALAGLNRYRAWLERTVSDDRPLDVDRERAAAILDGARRDGRSRLSELEALDLLDAYGVPVAPSGRATSAEEAARLSAELGYPVAMKASSPGLLHKSDVGGVLLGIEDAVEAKVAFDELAATVKLALPAEEMSGVLVQRQVGGQETICGISRDPLYGPLIMFGLGGIYVEALNDVVFRLAPVDSREATEMVRGIRGARMLQGMRGTPAADEGAIVDVLRRISQLATDLPAIAELDINPLFVRPDGAVAADARVLLAAQTAEAPPDEAANRA